MKIRHLALIACGAATLGACATTLNLPPTQVLRFHRDNPLARGTIAVVPAGDGAVSLESQAYTNVIMTELQKAGYTPTPAGQQAQYVASVAYTRRAEQGPPRQSPFSIGIGGGTFSGGRRGGGVGLGGGVGFPIGGSKASEVLLGELSVSIKRRSDQIPVWEGRAQGMSDIRNADQQAAKLAAALFTGFPGESGRTIEVR